MTTLPGSEMALEMSDGMTEQVADASSGERSSLPTALPVTARTLRATNSRLVNNQQLALPEVVREIILHRRGTMLGFGNLVTGSEVETLTAYVVQFAGSSQ